eukprot:TRINITY_DN21518_c0_g1_i1.p1 TRINITY_DN21518_c0_g1~~TRINITY_DN21518_c0_g1_i1.p1  ORF type:complete len:485 (-),score=115.63 TRINITY_DN21518_c0_g1_i1:406-1860(-)
MRLATAVTVLPSFVLLWGGFGKEEDSCPAGGGWSHGCGSVGTVLDEHLQCVRWRQTGGCSADGPREPHGDKPCGEQVESGNSGYCECGGGHRARLSKCDHRPFSCETECLQLRRYKCVAWRQTGGCSADGEREPHNDKACEENIDARASGYCECGDGRLVRKPGCDVGDMYEPFSCRDECAREPDMYEDLGVDSGASEKALKQAFRKLSLKYHPDKTRNDPALTARFLAIQEAYETVGDPERRAIYDALGFSGAKAKELEKGPESGYNVEVDLEAFYNGREWQMQIPRLVICRDCREKRTPRCLKICNAACGNEVELRRVQMGPMIMQQQVEVPSKERCRNVQTAISVSVEPGMTGGDTLIFKGMGSHKPKHIPGDVKLTLKEKKHKVFTRRGVNLHADMDISLREALLGFKRTLTHLDGHTVELSYDGVTIPFGIMRVRGEGMPHKGDPTSRGDLLVKFRVLMPEASDLDDEMRNFISSRFPK